MPSIHRSTKAPARYRLGEPWGGLSIRFDCIIFLRSALLFSPTRPGSTLSCPNGGNAPLPSVGDMRGCRPAWNSDSDRREPRSCQWGRHCRWRGIVPAEGM